MENMEKIILERQTSHRYNAGWSHLNESEFVGTARVLARKKHGRDYGESRAAFTLLLVSSKEEPETVIRSIHDTLRHSCRCEHDCCGHWQSHVSKVRHLRGCLYAVIEQQFINC